MTEASDGDELELIADGADGGPSTEPSDSVHVPAAALPEANLLLAPEAPLEQPMPISVISLAGCTFLPPPSFDSFSSLPPVNLDSQPLQIFSDTPVTDACAPESAGEQGPECTSVTLSVEVEDGSLSPSAAAWETLHRELIEARQARAEADARASAAMVLDYDRSLPILLFFM